MHDMSEKLTEGVIIYTAQEHSQDFLKGVPTAVLKYKKQGSGGTAPSRWRLSILYCIKLSKLLYFC